MLVRDDFFLFYRDGILQVSYLYQSPKNDSNMSLRLKDEDLHIYIIDKNNLKSSIKMLESLISKRTRLNKEFWMVDISALKNLENTELMLNGLELDIDDDILLYKAMETKVMVWEAYRFNPSTDIIIKEIASWMESMEGLDMVGLDKWKRRGNLMVIN